MSGMRTCARATVRENEDMHILGRRRVRRAFRFLKCRTGTYPSKVNSPRVVDARYQELCLDKGTDRTVQRAVPGERAAPSCLYSSSRATRSFLRPWLHGHRLRRR